MLREKIKESIREMVKSKLAILEQTIIDEISKKSILVPTNVHKGIKCSNCGMENIVGIRYKCTICPNFNLCEICEENIEHDEDHVLLKIKDPIISEEILEKKINDSLVIIDIDFKAEPEIFKFKFSNLINFQSVILTNNTPFVWKKGTSFVCVKEKSDLFANDIILENEVKQDNYIKIDLVFDDTDSIKQNKTEYYTSFKLVDENKKQIGKIHTFKIYMS